MRTGLTPAGMAQYPPVAIHVMRFAFAVLVWALSVPTAFAAPEIHPNDNRKPAGRLVGKTLRIELEAREGLWYPESKDGPGLPVQAFAERGKKLLAPGPQIRVPEGTQIRATIRNTLAEKMVLHGFHSRPGDPQDTVELAPGERREFSFDAGVAGTYYYWGSTMPAAPAIGRPIYRDAVLSGAFIVDPRGTKPDPEERVFMMANWRKDSCTRRQDECQARRGPETFLHHQRSRLSIHRTAHI